MNYRKQFLLYVFVDFLAAMLAWSLFFAYRKRLFFVDYHSFLESVIYDKKLYFGLILIPLFWIFVYLMVGLYRNLFRRSRLREIGQIFLASIIGVTVLFFVLILDDVIITYKTYYAYYIILFSLHFGLTALGRYIITSRTNRKIHRGELTFNTLLIGNNGNAKSILKEIREQKISTGNKFVGYIKTHPEYSDNIDLPELGTLDDIPSVIANYQIEEVIIAVEPSLHEIIEKALLNLSPYDVTIKIYPDYKDILSGSVRFGAIFHPPLIEVPRQIMPVWQQVLKRIIDIVVSIFVFIVLAPLYAFLAIGVKRSSKGPIFYKQERIGKNGKPFYIYKFRSMYVDAEKNGIPQLSSKNDPRVTAFGRFMRKYRLDELPQFFNVLKGEMTLVGPRPERQYYIDQIVQRAPHYLLLLKVKPGITSWGQVKFGYAENVDQMIERMKYDLLYIENMSLAMDFKIILYTLLVIFKGDGK